MQHDRRRIKICGSYILPSDRLFAKSCLLQMNFQWPCFGVCSFYKDKLTQKTQQQN